MTIVMELSTDADIRATALGNGWPAVTARYPVADVRQGGLNIPGGATIVTIAHGNGQEIGNRVPGSGVDIDATLFLVLIDQNVTAPPAAVYLSTCSPGIAEFTAAVRIAQQQQGAAAYRLYGHDDGIVGAVPSPSDMRWTQIF